MEPVLLVCGGCGVRIRTRHPEEARSRACPRCDTPLASAVDLALGIAADPTPVVEDGKALPTRGRRRWPTAAVAILVTIGSLASLAVREASPGSDHPASSPSIRPASIVAEAPRPVEAASPASEARPSARPEVAPIREPASPPAELAITDLDRREPVLPPHPRDAGPKSSDTLDIPPPPAPQPDPLPPALRQVRASESRRHRVRDGRGRVIVAREYGMVKGRIAAILPDGQIGWPESPVETEERFAPLSMDQMKRELLDDPEFTTFRVHQTRHYLVAYQCSDSFAKASAELLEKLHDGLTDTLKKMGLPVKAMEFPLVAVIFATEDDFRANRRVERDIQAYYEFFSNRIFFYEKSRRDQDLPEVSALRKPHTVAHEGTHQILNNVGIQPRLSDWPLWLVEGLAEYCSSARFTKKGVDWAGIGQANPIHLATIRDLEDPLPAQFRADRREAVVPRDRGMPLVEYLVTRKSLTPTDYAFAWALTHYLVGQRPDDFVEYLQRMSRLRPFEEQSPADQLTAFTDVFGGDLAQMDGKVGKHLKKFKQGDALPHYAVMFEQPVGPLVRRHYMVSQSPSVIRQWLESVTAPEGGPSHWRVFPHPTQKRALEAAEQWMIEGR